MEKISNEELARMIAKGFEYTANKDDISKLEKRMDHFDNKMNKFDNRMDNFDGRMNKFEGELSYIGAKLSTIENDVADIKRDMISRNEFEDLMGRVKYLEIKLGVESGK